LGTLTSVAPSTTLDAGTFLDFNGWNSTINNLQGAGTLANITDDVSASLGTTTILQGNLPARSRAAIWSRPAPAC
jgi:hypothetical protein